MSDLVERRWIGKETVGPACLTRLERVAEIWRDQGMTVTEWVPLAALEAAQARIEAVRREAVEECAQVAEERGKHHTALHIDKSRTPQEIKVFEAQNTAAAIRAITEAKEGRT